MTISTDDICDLWTCEPTVTGCFVCGQFYETGEQWDFIFESMMVVNFDPTCHFLCSSCQEQIPQATIQRSLGRLRSQP